MNADILAKIDDALAGTAAVSAPKNQRTRLLLGHQDRFRPADLWSEHSVSLARPYLHF